MSLIRDFQQGDATYVNALAVRAFEEFKDAYHDWPAFRAKIANMVALTDGGEIVVAEVEGRIVGAVAYVGPGAPKAGGHEALKRFATNFTEKARAGGIDPICGRHREIRQMVDIPARRRKNNPIIVGEPGVGKTALVEGLAVEIVNDGIPIY